MFLSFLEFIDFIRYLANRCIWSVLTDWLTLTVSSCMSHFVTGRGTGVRKFVIKRYGDDVARWFSCHQARLMCCTWTTTTRTASRVTALNQTQMDLAAHSPWTWSRGCATSNRKPSRTRWAVSVHSVSSRPTLSSSTTTVCLVDLWTYSFLKNNRSIT